MQGAPNCIRIRWKTWSMLWVLYMTRIILQKVVFLLISDSVNLFTDSFTVRHNFSSKDTLHFVRNPKSYSIGVLGWHSPSGGWFLWSCCKSARISPKLFWHKYRVDGKGLRFSALTLCLYADLNTLDNKKVWPLQLAFSSFSQLKTGPYVSWTDFALLQTTSEPFYIKGRHKVFS